MAWSLALWLLACTADPDARLRAGDLAGAASAWESRTGNPLDVAHPAAEILARRAPRDPTITVATIADTVAAVRLLERAPLKRNQEIDLSFGSFADLFAALDALVEPPALVAVGRSEGRGDGDPYATNAALPWKGGRLVGFVKVPAGTTSAPTFEPLGKAIEADPPARLVTVAMQDATGEVWFSTERRDGAWWAVGASDAEAAARLLLAAEGVRDYGGGTSRARQGGGFVRR